MAKPNHGSIVSDYVHQLLAEREPGAGGIGQQVREVARNNADGDPDVLPGQIILVHDGNQTTVATLAEAIEDAVDGDTILVGAGVYTESLTINESLTILGAEGATLNGGIYIGEGGDGTVIDNLDIEGGATVAGESGLIGVFVQANDVTISDSTFTGDETAGTADRGVLTSTGDFEGLTVSGNTFIGWDTGVYLNPGMDATVTGNTFTENEVGLSADQDANTVVQISGNSFSSSGLEHIGFGVLGEGANEDIGDQVFDNTFDESAPEVSVYLLGDNQTVVASDAADVFIWTDAGDAWTISEFDGAADLIDLGGAPYVAVVDGGNVEVTIGATDLIVIAGQTSFDPGWIV